MQSLEKFNSGFTCISFLLSTCRLRFGVEFQEHGGAGIVGSCHAVDYSKGNWS